MKRVCLYVALFLFSTVVLLTFMFMLMLDPCGLFTITPSGFSSKAWNNVQEGMSKDDVLRFMPLPIDRCDVRDSDRCVEYWQYSGKRKWNVMFMDYKVFFDEHGRVVGKKSSVDCD